MEVEYKKIEEQIQKIAPIKKTIEEANTIEMLHNLIKTNGKDFNLSSEELELIEKLRKMNIIEFHDNRIILDRRYSTKALVEFIKNEYNSSIESYINPKKTIEEIKGNKYNIWNCGFINFKEDFSF